MRKSILLISFVMLSSMFLFGCDTMVSNPTIKDLAIEPAYVNQGETVSIGYKVFNPLSIGFVGSVEYKSDCITNLPPNKEIDVKSGETKSFKSTVTAGRTIKCTGTQQVTVILKDNNDKTIHYSTAEMNIVEN